MSFASAVKYVMEGFLSSRKRRVNLETELTEFHEYHKMRGTDKFDLLPSDEFQDLSDYLEFLRDDCRIAAFGAEINGGAQFQRLKLEVEIYFRFAEVCGAIEARDVIQARGISVGQVTWADAVTKLLAKEGHAMTQRKINYVGERIRWFFETQKEVILEFMDEVCGAPDEHMYSRLFPQRAQLIRENHMMRELIWKAYDDVLERQLESFVLLFANTLQSTFANPMAMLKASSIGSISRAAFENVCQPSLEDTKARIPTEIEAREQIHRHLKDLLDKIPTDAGQIEEAVEKCQVNNLTMNDFKISS